MAVCILTQRRGELKRNANRRFTVLGHGGVVDDRPSLIATNQFIRLVPQGRFQRSTVPQTRPDEMKTGRK